MIKHRYLCDVWKMHRSVWTYCVCMMVLTYLILHKAAWMCFYARLIYSSRAHIVFSARLFQHMNPALLTCLSCKSSETLVCSHFSIHGHGDWYLLSLRLAPDTGYHSWELLYFQVQFGSVYWSNVKSISLPLHYYHFLKLFFFFCGGGFGKNCLLPFTASSCNWSIFIVYHFNCRDITLKEYSCSFQLTPYLQ